MFDWQKVEQHPKFAALDDSGKAKVKQGFFNETVRKHPKFAALGTEEQAKVETAFFSPPAPAEPAPAPSRSLIPDIGSGIVRGAAGVPQMFLRAGAGIDEIIDSMTGEGGGFDLKTWARAKEAGIEHWKEKTLPVSAEHMDSYGRRSVVGGTESAVTSLGSKAPGTAAGAAIGFAFGGPMGALAGGILGYLSGVPLFSLAQYDEALTRYREQGVDESDAQLGAALEAASEGGFELFTDVIEIATLGGGKVLTTPAKAALKRGAVSTLSGTLKRALMKGGVVAGAETVGELLNVGTQAEISKEFAGTDQRFFDAIKESAGEIGVASVLFGALGGGLHYQQQRRVKKALESEKADPAERMWAAEQVGEAIEKVAPDLAARWFASTSNAIQKGEPIDLTSDIAAWPDPTTRLSGTPEPGADPMPAGADASAEPAAASPGEKPPRPMATAADEATNTPHKEAGPAEGTADLAPAETPAGAAAKEAAAPMEPDQEAKKALEAFDLPPSVKRFVEGKIAKIGNVDGVEQLYNSDSEVDEYARAYASVVFDGQTPPAPAARPRQPEAGKPAKGEAAREPIEGEHGDTLAQMMGPELSSYVEPQFSTQVDEQMATIEAQLEEQTGLRFGDIDTRDPAIAHEYRQLATAITAQSERYARVKRAHEKGYQGRLARSKADVEKERRRLEHYLRLAKDKLPTIAPIDPGQYPAGPETETAGGQRVTNVHRHKGTSVGLVWSLGGVTKTSSPDYWLAEEKTKHGHIISGIGKTPEEAAKESRRLKEASEASTEELYSHKYTAEELGDLAENRRPRLRTIGYIRGIENYQNIRLDTLKAKILEQQEKQEPPYAKVAAREAGEGSPKEGADRGEKGPVRVRGDRELEEAQEGEPQAAGRPTPTDIERELKLLYDNAAATASQGDNEAIADLRNLQKAYEGYRDRRAVPAAEMMTTYPEIGKLFGATTDQVQAAWKKHPDAPYLVQDEKGRLVPGGEEKPTEKKKPSAAEVLTGKKARAPWKQAAQHWEDFELNDKNTVTIYLVEGKDGTWKYRLHASVEAVGNLTREVRPEDRVAHETREFARLRALDEVRQWLVDTQNAEPRKAKYVSPALDALMEHHREAGTAHKETTQPEVGSKRWADAQALLSDQEKEHLKVVIRASRYWPENNKLPKTFGLAKAMGKETAEIRDAIEWAGGITGGEIRIEKNGVIAGVDNYDMDALTEAILEAKEEKEEEVSPATIYQADMAVEKPSSEVAKETDRYREMADGTRYRKTPPGQKTVPEIVQPGDIVKSNYSDMEYEVIDVGGPYADSEEYPPHYDLGLIRKGQKRNKDGTLPKNADSYSINELVAQDGRLLMLFEANDDEVFVIEKASRPQEGEPSPIGETAALGKNEDGHELYEDKDGNRYYVEGDFRIPAARQLGPTGGKREPLTPRELFERRSTQFLTTEEVARFAAEKEKKEGKPAAGPIDETEVDSFLPDSVTQKGIVLGKNNDQFQTPKLTKAEASAFLQRAETAGYINYAATEYPDGQTTIVVAKAPEKGKPSAAEVLTGKRKPEKAAKAKEPWEMMREDVVWEGYIPDGLSTDRALAGRLARWEKIKREAGAEGRKIESVEQAIAKEAARIDRANNHRAAVKQALSEGKPVPSEVLAEYPDLKPSPAPEAERRSAWETREQFEQVLARVGSVEEAREMARQMAKKAYTDALTGLKNRASWIETRIKHPEQAVLAYDLDNFSWYNDVLGHGFGDKVLKQFAQILKEEGLDPHRIGGDELMDTGDGHAALYESARRVRARMAEEVDAEVELTKDVYKDGKLFARTGDTIYVRGIGVSYGIGENEKQADGALYADKSNRVEKGLRAEKGGQPPTVSRGGPVGQLQEPGRGEKAPAAQEPGKEAPARKLTAAEQLAGKRREPTAAEKESLKAIRGRMIKRLMGLFGEDAYSIHSDFPKIVNSPDIGFLRFKAKEFMSDLDIDWYFDEGEDGRTIEDKIDGIYQQALDELLAAQHFPLFPKKPSAAAVLTGKKQAPVADDAEALRKQIREAEETAKRKANIAARKRWEPEVQAEAERRGRKGPIDRGTEKEPLWSKDIFDRFYQEELERRQPQVEKLKAKLARLQDLTKPAKALKDPWAGVTTKEQATEIIRSKGFERKSEYLKRIGKENAAPHEQTLSEYMRATNLGIFETWSDSAASTDIQKMIANSPDQIVFQGKSTRDIHKEAVEQALAEGEAVPAEVLADYPELTKPAEGITEKKKEAGDETAEQGTAPEVAGQRDRDRSAPRRPLVPGSTPVAGGQRAGVGGPGVSGEPGAAAPRAGAQPAAGDTERGAVPAPAQPSGPRGPGAGTPADHRTGRRPEPGSGPARTAEPGQETRDTELGRGPGDRLAPADRNHVIEKDDVIAPAGAETKIRTNISAIRLLKKLQAENRNPTAEEKKQLAQYVGWGAFAQKVFNKSIDRYLREHSDQEPRTYFLYNGGKTSSADFDAWKKKYGNALHPALGGLMTQEEWDAAAESTLNAHYTSAEVIGAMWDMARHLGFATGRVVEPAAGVGHFFGLMPQDLSAKSELMAVELDSITGGILEKLYPQADIQITGFEDARGIPDNSVDLVISNFPFGKYPVYDKAHPQYDGWSIHNYFFGRSIDAVRPGGLVIGITSHWTLDSKSGGDIRTALNEKADLVGAIRLPKTAFEKNAGTEVVTDIVVFRKKDGASHGLGQDVTVSAEVDMGDEQKAQINEYFLNNPQMVLGTHAMSGKMRHGGGEYTVVPVKGTALSNQIAEAIGRLPAKIMGEGSAAKAVKLLRAEAHEREGQLVEKEGRFYRVEEGRLVEPYLLNSKNQMVKAFSGTLEKSRQNRARDYLALKRAARNIIARSQEEDATDSEIDRLREDLNRIYDGFVKQYKAIGDPANSFLRKIDNEFPVVAALERQRTDVIEDTFKSGAKKGQPRVTRPKTYEKADIFKMRTIRPFKAPESAETTADAANLSLIYQGRLDLSFMAGLLQESEESVKKDVLAQEIGFEDPETGLIEQADLYLSGNVKHKLEAARRAAEQNPEYEKNVKALEAVQPDPLDIEFIHFKLGTPWVPEGAVEDFVKHLLGLTVNATLSKSREHSNWHIETVSGDTRSVANREKWGVFLNDRWDVVRQGETDPINSFATQEEARTWLSEQGISGDVVFVRGQGSKRLGSEIIKDSLNLKRSVVYDYYRDENGNTRREKNTEATEAAQEKQRDIQDEFLRWGRRHPEWAKKLENAYNESANSYRLRKFPTPDIVRYPGMSVAVNLRGLQKRFIARGLQESFVAAYGVGTGKTYSFIGTAMEMRRVGTAQKPCIVVQNSTIGQYAEAFYTLYPQAKVLIPNETERSAAYRQRLLGQIATGDWAAVILPHSFFDSIANDPMRERAFVEQALADIEAAISDAEQNSEEGANDPNVKDLEAIKKRKEAALDKLLDRRVDDALFFEQLGIDALLVDEAHSYKRSEFFTKLGTVKGIDQGSSQKSTSLLLKSRYVQEKTGGKNVILATGTPISNTTAELWTMLRYVRPDLLEDYGVDLFDSFATVFGDTSVTMEETESGTYKDVERFNKYVNGPELLTMWHTAADVVLTQQAGLNLPEVAGGAPVSVEVPRTPELTQFIDRLRAAREHWEDMPPKDKMQTRYVPLLLYGMARKAAVDMRLVDPQGFSDHPDSKLNKVVQTVYEIWEKTTARESTQAIFLDRYQDSTGAFNAYEDIRAKLIERGVPKNEIALVNEANTDAQREALFSRIREGKIRVVIGSTAKLGIGVNMQNRLVAVHHVDAPDRPMDIEQRNGRIVREGNENKEVQIYNYGVKATLDSVLYDRLTKKQRFIDQILTGDIESRTFDDPLSEEQMSLAEMNAAFAGNPLVFEKTDADVKVKRLRRAKARHERTVSAARRDAEFFETYQIPRNEQDLAEVKQAAAMINRQVPTGKLGEFVHEGQALSRKEISDAIKTFWDDYETRQKAELDGITWKDWQPISDRDRRQRMSFTANGLTVLLELDAEAWGDKPGSYYKRHPGSKLGIRFDNHVDVRSADGTLLASRRVNAAGGTLVSIGNSLKDVTERPARAEAAVEKKKKELTELKKLAKQPFDKEQDLIDAEKRLIEVEAELRKIERQKGPEEGEGEGQLSGGGALAYFEDLRMAAKKKDAGGYYVRVGSEYVMPELHFKKSGKTTKVDVHPDIHAFAYKKEDGYWVVSEATAGVKISDGRTKNEAIETARLRLARLSTAEIRSKIDGALMEAGAASPWVEENSVSVTIPTAEIYGISEDHPGWAQDHASHQTRGRVVYSGNDLALVQGFSMTTGNQVFAAGREDKGFTRIDIEHYTGDEFSDTEKDRLVEAKRDFLEKEARLQADNPDGPFGEVRTVRSPSMPEQYRQLLSDLQDLTGLTETRIWLVNPADIADDAREAYRLYGDYSRPQEIPLRLNRASGAAFGPEGKDYYINLPLSKNRLENIEVMAHELGHIVKRELFQQATEEEKLALQAAWSNWRAKVIREAKTGADLVRMSRPRAAGRSQLREGANLDTPLDQIQNHADYTAFNEWFADNVAKWVVTNKKPQTLIEKVFARIGRALKRLYSHLTGKEFFPDRTVAEFIERRAVAELPDGPWDMSRKIVPPPKEPPSLDETLTADQVGEAVDLRQRGRDRADQSIDQVTARALPEQPKGRQAAMDYEQARSFANRIFERRDVGVHNVDVFVRQLQKAEQMLAGKASRRKFTMGFAYDKKYKRSLASDRLSMALMLHRDMQINPEKATEFRTWADQVTAGKIKVPPAQKLRVEEQLKVLAVAESLTAEQIRLADFVGELYEKAYRTAHDAKIVQTHRENYVRRLWDFKESQWPDIRPAEGTIHGFKVHTTAAKARTLQTIFDGWMAGYDLKVKGLSSSYGHYMRELETILANKTFIEEGYSTRDTSGRRLFDTVRHEGYEPLKASAFQVWEWAGSAKTEVEGPLRDYSLVVDDHGRRFFAAPIERTPETFAVFKAGIDGKIDWKAAPRPVRVFLFKKEAEAFAASRKYKAKVVQRRGKDIANYWEKRQLYAPRELADTINKMTATDVLFSGTKALEHLIRFNAGIKSWILLSSFFHHLAGSRSWAFGVHHGWRSKEIIDPYTGEALETAGVNPIRAYKAGLKKIEDRHALIALGVKNGLTIGEVQDWAETMLRDEKGYSERLANRLGLKGLSNVMAFGRHKREKFTDSLFRKFFAGLKAEAFCMEFVHELQKAQDKQLQEGAPPPEPDKIAGKVGRLINADFGGLHLKRMGRHPSLQKIARLLLLAPDWCVLGDTRAMTKNGWKYWYELTIGKDEILAFDPDTKKFKWSMVADLYANKNYCGQIVKVKNHNRFIGMTPDHTCFVYNATKKMHEIIPADRLKTQHRIPRRADFDFPNVKTYSNRFVRLCGWLVTDGYVKKSCHRLASGETRQYRYGKITQSKPVTVEILKNMGLTYHIDKHNSDHGKFKANYEKHVFNIPNEDFAVMQNIGLDAGLNWDFLSRLTRRQLEVLYDTMMLACGTGQNRFSGKERIVFYVTMIQALLGSPVTFYQQEPHCWRTRPLSPLKNNITCTNTVEKTEFTGTIWCPSVDTGFWFAEREGLTFITGNTESNFRTVTGMVPGLNDWISKMIGDLPAPPGMGEVYRKFWGRVALRIVATTVLAQLIFNGWDDSEEFYEEQLFSGRWNKFRWTEWDITGLYKTLGVETDGRRKTFSIGGHFFDPLKLTDPPRLIKAKGSPLTRIVESLFSASNWREQPYTDIGELARTGRVTKKSPHEGKEGFFERLPSTVVDQVTNMQPVQVGYLLRMLQGEEDGLSALMLSTGAHVHTAWPAKIEAPVARSAEPDAAKQAASEKIEQLRDAGVLTMGPPAGRITISGVPTELSRAQYEDYYQRSTELALAKLSRAMERERWESLSEEQQAGVVEKIIKSARKAVRGRIKVRVLRDRRQNQAA